MGFFGLLTEKILNENASVENVTRAMDNHSKVIINYHTDGKDNNTGTRIIEPVAYGLTSAGNPVIRAYQPYGDTTSKTPSWKLFRLDRITYWEETNEKFDSVPKFEGNELNMDGDNSMTTVIKTYRSTLQNDATNGKNIGPKTKEKVFATTSGDDRLALGKKNLSKMQNGGIKIDLDNNRKVKSIFNAYTNKTQQSTGPKFPDQSYKPEQPKIQNGNINKDELEKARQEVYNDYQHEYTPYEKQRADYDNLVNNRKSYQNKDLSINTRKFDRENQWKKSADSRFLNRKNSGNRELYDLDSKLNNNKDLDDNN